MKSPIPEQLKEVDIYHDYKKYHMAKLMDPRGNVSPLCADTPRPLNLRRELWTLRPEAVTCTKCTARLVDGGTRPKNL